MINRELNVNYITTCMKIKGNYYNYKQTTDIKMCNLAYATSLVDFY